MELLPFNWGMLAAWFLLSDVCVYLDSRKLLIVTSLEITGSMYTVSGVVFDLDGTLVSSHHDYGEMTRRVTQILTDAGVELAVLKQPGQVWRVTRGGDESMKGLGFTEEQKTEISRHVTEALNAVEVLSLETLEVMPNAYETLEHLSSEGFSLGIATRACNEYSVKALEMTGLDGFIDYMLARDMVENPKPDPRHLLEVLEALSLEPDDSVYIGDTTTDLRTAKSAKVTFIGYLRSPRWAERLKEAGCDAEITDLSELKKLLIKR